MSAPRLGPLAIAAFLLLGCRHAALAPRPAGEGGARESATRDSAARTADIGPEPRTTDGAIAIGNLEAQIEGEEHLASYGPLTVAQRAGIADLIAMRGQFLGRIRDYERAEEIAESLVRDAPDDGRAYLARAGARATFHRFPEALADLLNAERLGAGAAAVESARAGVLQGAGSYDEALEIRRRVAGIRPDISSLGAEATLRGDRGEIGEAERLFSEALRLFRDVSPFPVAWLAVQRGLMWEREGDLDRARDLFQAACARLPAYAAAQGHLAEAEAALGRPERAADLLRPLASSSDDPDYAAQLARILVASGQDAEARHWREAAAARFDELLARHPTAFADHAAEFYMSAGGDPGRALALARINVLARPTPRARELVLQAALAAGDRAAACAAAGPARAIARPWPRLRALLSRASEACGGTSREPGP